MKILIKDGYIIGFTESDIGKGEKVSDEFAEELRSKMESIPAAPEGFYYRLKTNLEWEMHELPPAPPEPEEEATAEDYENALGRFGV